MREREKERTMECTHLTCVHLCWRSQVARYQGEKNCGMRKSDESKIPSATESIRWTHWLWERRPREKCQWKWKHTRIERKREREKEWIIGCLFTLFVKQDYSAWKRVNKATLIVSPASFTNSPSACGLFCTRKNLHKYYILQGCMKSTQSIGLVMMIMMMVVMMIMGMI